jgi:hypothetical protein
MQRINSLTEYCRYFKEEIADRFTPIKDFYQIDMFEFKAFEDNLRGGKFKTPLLILEHYSRNTIARYTDNLHDELHGALVVLGKYDIRDTSPDLRMKFLTEIEAIILQIRLKMIMDYKTPCRPLKGLIVPSMQIQKTETIANNFQGYRLEFTIEEKAIFELDNNWT